MRRDSRSPSQLGPASIWTEVVRGRFKPEPVSTGHIRTIDG